MAFLRVKSTRGRAYLYLVENRWDVSLGHARQRVLRYLGPLERARIESLPAPWRTRGMRVALARLQEEQRVRRAPAEAALADAFHGAILAGDATAARGAARAAVRASGLDGFYGRTVPEVFRRIGEAWQSGGLSIPQEHLATGVALQIVAHLNDALPPPTADAPEVLLAVPEGETHTLALSLAEGLLRQRGFRPLNLSGTAPTGAIVAFAEGRRPAAVVISVTEPRRLGGARTLGARIKAASPSSRVAVGGQAVNALSPGANRSGLEIIPSALSEFLGDWTAASVRRSSSRSRRSATERSPTVRRPST